MLDGDINMGLLRDMLDVFKTLKRRQPSKIYCPKCGNAGIHLATGADFWLTPKKYVCENCGYHGILVMELEKGED
jgi:predicted RNA-binding Zn-ribbon protein involved in translation (DUF1610 family)